MSTNHVEEAVAVGLHAVGTHAGHREQLAREIAQRGALAGDVEQISVAAAQFEAAGEPVISVDTKKKGTDR